MSDEIRIKPEEGKIFEGKSFTLENDGDDLIASNIKGGMSESSKKPPVINSKDTYWDVLDEDENYDGLLRIVSTVDGSSIKIPLKAIMDEIAKHKGEDFTI